MHKIHEKEFTIEDFSCERLISCWDYNESERDKDKCAIIDFAVETTQRDDYILDSHDILRLTIDMLNKCRTIYNQTKDKKYFDNMIQLLPSSYNQKRTVMLNYEVLHNMYISRKNHKLDEWVEFCKWIETLPYSELITGGEQ